MEGHLEAYSIPANTLAGLKEQRHFQREVDQKNPMDYSLADIEECYSGNLASETHIGLAGS